MRSKKPTLADVARWRRSAFEVQRSEVVAGRARGPEPPRAWAPVLRRLIDASQHPDEGPPWWTPANAYFGNVETRTDPRTYHWDGMKRLGRGDPPLVFFQFTLAGFGHFEQYGRQPHVVLPGTGFFAVVPSRHRYYLPATSPGWTFAWIGIYHPYVLRRIARRVEAAGPLVQGVPRSPLVTHLLRLVRGAFLKDFRDRLAVEQELFSFMHAFERLEPATRSADGERLLDTLRARVLADPRAPLSVTSLAADHGLSRSAFSHHFRARTGSSPAHFVTEIRVQVASRLLVETRLPLASIAERCGFANANHFGKVFRRFRRLSAGEYRRSFG